MFQFKQFSVDQSGCAMKINTDGVLLGAIADAESPETILDIGTGTGVIALMLAQRFIEAKIDAVEIDASAAKTAQMNFKNSPFTGRLTVYTQDFESYFDQFPERKYDLIVSNPPFYINSLKSPGALKTLAKHTDVDFFEKLIKCIASRLTDNGCCWLVLPVDTGEVVMKLAGNYSIYPKQTVAMHSYDNAEAHRVIICFAFGNNFVEAFNLTIYKAANVYTEEYKKLLQPYFLAF